MGFLHIDQKRIHDSDQGHIEIPESKLIHSSIPEVDKVLTEEYAQLVENNPHHEFTIIRDRTKIRISWRRREE